MRNLRFSENIGVLIAGVLVVSSLSGCASSEPSNGNFKENKPTSQTEQSVGKTPDTPNLEEQAIEELKKLILKKSPDKNYSAEDLERISKSVVNYCQVDKISDDPEYAKDMNRFFAMVQYDAEDNYQISQIWVDLQPTDEKREIIRNDIELINKTMAEQDYKHIEPELKKIMKESPDHSDHFSNFRTILYGSCFTSILSQNLDIIQQFSDYYTKINNYFN